MTDQVEQLKERVIDLEARVAFQEDHLSTLNQRLVEQDNELAKLQIQLKHLHDKVKDGDSGPVSSGDYSDERPPHY